MPSGQMIEDDLIGQGQPFPLLAVGARDARLLAYSGAPKTFPLRGIKGGSLDARLFAYPGAPLVRTSRRVAAFAGLSFPSGLDRCQCGL